MPMTNSQYRVVDPVLTEIARGFKDPELVGKILFPTVNVPKRAGNLIVFGDDAFRLYDTVRSPGSATKRVESGYSSISFALKDRGIEAKVIIENQEEAAGILNLSMMQVNQRRRDMARGIEYEQSVLATTTGNYASGHFETLSGSTQWSHASSTPTDDVLTAMELIRSKIGIRPNVMLMGASVLAKLRNHAEIVDRIKYTGRDSVTTDLLAELWGLKSVAVGESMYVNDSGVRTDFWGDNVIIAYTETGSMADMGAPSFGYHYQLNGYPIVEPPYDDRNSNAIYYPIRDVSSPYIVGNTAGFLFKDVIA